MGRRTVSWSWSLLLALITGALLPSAASAQAPEGAILLIMDASGSMEATDADGVRLIDGAKDALRGVVDTLPDGTHVGLRVYGHREPNTDQERGCRDTELISPVQPLDRDAMRAAIDGFEPSGFTPIGASLQAAADDLPPEGPRTIILVSDGEDTCAPPDPCEVAAELRGDGVDLVVETVGFALGTDEAARQQLECIAEAGGGTFTDVATAADLVDELEVVATREARRFQPEGDVVEPGTSPRDAPTLQFDVTYQADRVGGEEQFFRFEVPAGAVLDLRATLAAMPSDVVGGHRSGFVLEVVDRDLETLGCDCPYGQPRLTEMRALAIRGLELEPGTDEIYVKISDRGGFTDPELVLSYDFSVELVEGDGTADDGEETVDEPAPEPDEGPTALPALEDAGAPGLPAWAAVVMTLLAVLVLALGAAVTILLRRGAGAATGAPAAGTPSGPTTGA